MLDRSASRPSFSSSPRTTTRARLLSLALGAAALCPFVCASAAAQGTELITVVSTLNLPSNPSPCGIAGDAGKWRLFVYDCAATVINRYEIDGTPLGSIDVSTLAPSALGSLNVMYEFFGDSFGGVDLGDHGYLGKLLLIDGGSGATRIHAFDIETNSYLATLNTAFGDSHVVGATFNSYTQTIFLLQNRDAPTNPNTIAEIDPATGAVLRTISTAAWGFDIAEGDIDAAKDGELLVVSSIESTMAKVKLDGTLRREIPISDAITGITGLESTGTGPSPWITDVRGQVFGIRGFRVLTCGQDYNQDDVVDILDFLDFFDDFGNCVGLPVPCGAYGDPDMYNADGQIDVLDFLSFFEIFSQPCIEF